MARLKTPGVGIDFGTSNCSVGVWEKDRPILLPLEAERVLRMPSVLFLAGEWSIAPIPERELTRRVRSAKSRQASERRVAESELGDAERNLQKAESRLRAYERRLANASADRLATDSRSLIDLVTRQEGEVETRQAMRDVLARQVNSLSKSDGELRAEQTLVLRREVFQRNVTEAARSDLEERLAEATGIYFGTGAIRRYAEGAEGNFIVSPKSYIGADVPRRQLTAFADIVAHMLTYMRSIVLRRFSDTGLAVVGRPVRFRGTAGAAGDEQAERVLREAASAAGFQAVEFLFEPIAAALDYERTLHEDKTLLVFDVGGGTTDCTMIRVGPSYRERFDRKSDVLGTDGIRLGGKDLDVALADGTVAPLLGKGTMLKDDLPFPSYYIQNAISMNIPKRNEFHSVQTEVKLQALANRSRSPERIRRLLKVQKGRLGEYVLWQAEEGKIQLSQLSSTRVELDRIEHRLWASASREHYERLAAETHRKLTRVVDEVITQAGVQPDELYLTGGMAQSPSLRAALRNQTGELKTVDGDFFGSVASGLTTWAHRHSD